MFHFRTGAVAAVYLVLCAVRSSASPEDDARKVLSTRCWACHSQTAMGNLRLDSRQAMLRGGASGAAIVPGEATKSRLYQAVSRDVAGVKPMPPGASLTSAETLTLRLWIDNGAPWTEQEGHWAFRPITKNSKTGGLDELISEVLKKKSLPANPQADRRTLIRRAYFDLVGLPPDETDYVVAVQDQSPDWFAHLVSRLLSSPHFGEKWARHWLDVARYGEDDFSGTAVIPYSNAWRYRDWVVGALNRNLPYDRFLMAQLAGDLMNDSSLLPATGLLGLGPWYYGIAQPVQSRADERNDRVDMVSRGMLGVTLACARCHDHKYDPFTAKDYYALSGVFASTAYKEYPLVSDDEVQAWKKKKEQVDAAEKALKTFLDERSAQIAEGFSTQIAAYMMAAVNGNTDHKLHPKVVERWKTYLSKPEESHPFLKEWFQGKKDPEVAASFQKLMVTIWAEKKALDEENKKLIESGKKNEPKVALTITLPGGYRSEEDFNPGAYIPSKSMDRDRFVAYNRTFQDTSAPLKFDRDLTAELLPNDYRSQYEQLKKSADDLKKALPPQYPYLQGAGEFASQDLKLNIRGNPESLGEVVPRRFPLVLSGGKEIRFDQGSGRLQLADTVAHHPLAARVAVNRIWLALFGQGLVRTPSNFGRVGDRPALPEVLEFLSARFVENGYSFKGTIREIMLSDAYQRSSTSNAANAKIDPDNRYLWRQNRRRLEAEPLRDAMLAVAGELDRSIGGESKPLTADYYRRTLYAKTSRFQQDETLSLFDLPSASVTCEQRAVTNVPLQKLFFLNSEAVIKRAAAFAKRIESDTPDAGITRAYSLLFKRAPTAHEREAGRKFLESSESDRWQQYSQVLLSSNEFAYVD